MGVTFLESLASIYLGLNLNKVHWDEDFYVCPYSILVQKYVALDALVSRKIGQFLRSKNTFNDDNLRPDVLQTWKGDAVSYLVEKRVAAVGTITFVGGNGNQTKYKNATVGTSKVLFEIKK